MLAGFGIEEGRVRLEWISAAEGDKVRTVINDMVGQLRPLGPLAWSERSGARALAAEPAAIEGEPEAAHA
jgi:hypothetical protein